MKDTPTTNTPVASNVNRYRIVSGSFRDSDGSIKGVGDTLELADHDAATHGMAIELVGADDETEKDPAAALPSGRLVPGMPSAAP